MNNDNWLDRLAALRESMPEADQAEPQKPETPATDEAPAQSGRLDIVFERTISDEAIDQLASELKRSLGTGGSARGGEILVQGDRRNDVLKFLNSKGLKARII